MKIFILGGKVVTLFAWIVMIYNLFMPIEGNIGILLNMLFAVTLLMHCVQVLIFHTLFKSLMTIRKTDYLSVLLFGVFSLLAYRQQILANGKSA
ncbi:DUF1145 domain-containing protein [Shewanella sp. Isolate11]|uniref:DUF1145 domain-containing protein n=1 Tax=Shewanella sp. Isolate11 TaxID=2908530 RepID=UPI001EFCEB27|nr:DUF1145 domain-containing protein [Shewanella sp. Isolate11]MCG9697900.1 DUF1145 domain-containing protein [Shewanella sp. Isolate11]